MSRRFTYLVSALLSAAFCNSLSADVVIETVTIGNPGNADDLHGDRYGGVNYIYDIGKYEVTASSIHGVPQRRGRDGYLRAVQRRIRGQRSSWAARIARSGISAAATRTISVGVRSEPKLTGPTVR